MSSPRRGVATSESHSDSIIASFHGVDRAIEDLRSAIRTLRKSREAAAEAARSRPSLVAGGTVLLTDDGQGIARAVAADLKALGHHVIRVRHGVGDGTIEGVNLSSAAAVAALIERVRGHGHLAAIIHAAPLSIEPNHANSWDQPDDARALALLAQASADDLIASASQGGSSLIVARFQTTENLDIQGEKLARWVEISARSLKDVRVRSLMFQPGGEPEVVAAEVVRAVLGTSEPAPIAGQISSMPVESRAIFLGAPDRASWLHLASALADWLEDSPTVDLNDLAYTLHHRQPHYAFRVGLVAASAQDMRLRLIQTISELANVDCPFIYDLSGAYWFGLANNHSFVTSPKKPTMFRGQPRLCGIPRRSPMVMPHPTVESLLERSGRQWYAHRIAVEFARSGRMDWSFIDETESQLLDLSLPLPDTTQGSAIRQRSTVSQGFVEALDALDSVIRLRREFLSEFCGF